MIAKNWGTGLYTLERLDLIEKLLEECVTSVATVTRFLEKPRKYTADDSLYMREVHFVVALGAKEHPTMSEMAEYLDVTPGAVTQMVTRLEKKGYVIRSRSSKDKRQTTISLTEKGKRLCENHIAYDRQEHMAISKRLAECSDEALEEFIHYVKLIRVVFTNNE